MSFWNNPEYTSVKVIALVVVLGGLGWFVFGHTTSGDKGLVLNLGSISSILSGKTAPTPAPQAAKCTAYEKPVTMGPEFCSRTYVRSDCSTNTTYGMVSGVKPNQKCGALDPNASAVTTKSVTNVASSQGLIFTSTVTGNTCTMSVISSANAAESITVVGTPAKNGDCTPNAKQATTVAQGMANAMGTGVSVQQGTVNTQTQLQRN